MSLGGKDSTWKHGTNGAVSSNTDFTTKTRELDPVFDGEHVDATVFGDSYRDSEQSFKSAEISSTYKYDTTVWGQLTAIYNAGDTVTFEIGPTGAANGNAKITGSMFITKIGTKIGIGELLEIVVSWQVSGAVTFTTFSA